jgi:diguanylate cyclase (GGDEF)-like protein/putative nucleotidyltransferase with HDIG domain
MPPVIARGGKRAYAGVQASGGAAVGALVALSSTSVAEGLGLAPPSGPALGALATLGLLAGGGLHPVRAALRRHPPRGEPEAAPVEHLELRDPDTGLGNHRALHEDLRRRLERRGGRPSGLAVVVLDLDGFSRVNETYGRERGDAVLRAVAECLRAAVRAEDAAYRLGGDEFAVVLHGERSWGGFRFSQRLHQQLATHSELELPSATLGVAEASGLEGGHTVIRHASLALHEAKRADRKVLIYSDALEPTRFESRRETERRHLKTLTTALARACDAKDSYTRSHCETVAETCALMAAELGLDDERAAKLRLAGLLHDIGKIGVADAILQKPARLTEAEFEVMKTHARLGHSIVGGAELGEVADWILHHHERPDGQGYPEGLQGEEVPLESRVILVADAFEAITSDRPYRRGRSEREAFVELERHAGTQFDAVCVDALRRALGGRRTAPLRLAAG